MDNKKNKKNKKQRIRPPFWATIAFCLISKFILFFKGRVKFNRKKLKPYKKDFILIYNHYSNYDHYLVSAGMNFRSPNFVLTNYYYYNKFLAKVLDLYRAIKKDQFKPDTLSIRKMKRAVEKKAIIAIAPTGQVSIDGTIGYLSEAVVKLIRLCGVDVIAQRSHGAHICWPKWRLASRKSKVYVDYEVVLTKDEIKELSDEEIYQRVRNSIAIDDYAEQEVKMNKIKSKSLTAGLENVFIRCPKCGAKYSYEANKHELVCNHCHNHIIMNKYGFLEGATSDDVTFKNEAEWIIWQKEVLKKEYFNTPNYKLSTKVNVKNNPHHERLLEDVGSGVINLTKDRLYYEGTNLGEDCTIEFNYQTLVQLPFKLQHHFEVPSDKTTFMYLPIDNQKVIFEWVQLIDIIRENRENNGN